MKICENSRKRTYKQYGSLAVYRVIDKLFHVAFLRPKLLPGLSIDTDQTNIKVQTDDISTKENKLAEISEQKLSYIGRLHVQVSQHIPYKAFTISQANEIFQVLETAGVLVKFIAWKITISIPTTS